MPAGALAGWVHPPGQQSELAWPRGRKAHGSPAARAAWHSQLGSGRARQAHETQALHPTPVWPRAGQGLGRPISRRWQCSSRTCTSATPTGEVECGSMFSCWKSWCELQNRDRVGTVQTFGAEMKAAVPGLKIVRPRTPTGLDRGRYYAGFRLRMSTRSRGLMPVVRTTAPWSAHRPEISTAGGRKAAILTPGPRWSADHPIVYTYFTIFSQLSIPAYNGKVRGPVRTRLKSETNEATASS